MTNPRGDNIDPDYNELRKRWLNRYVAAQASTDIRVRTILTEAAQDAEKQVSALEKSSLFSMGVRTAQLRLVTDEIKEVLQDVFGKLIPVIGTGQKKAAISAVTAFNETDRQYLVAAFKNSGNVGDFIDGQRTQAQLQVANAISGLTKSDIPLSARVYRSRSLANRWVKRQVLIGITRGDSAGTIAKSVRASILPNVRGGVGYAAMRLGRTEVNNAFHATTVELAKDRPWVEAMAWNLSKVHEMDPAHLEICEQYSLQEFTVDTVPQKPHPQCRCFTTPKLMAFETFISNLTAGRYEDWIDNAA